MSFQNNSQNSGFSPNQNIVKEIIQVLHLSLRGEKEIQDQVNQKLDQFRNKFQLFNPYLAFICVKMSNVPPHIRQLAGVLLKNDFKKILAKCNNEMITYIKNRFIEGLASQVEIVRRVCGQCISTFLNIHGVQSWPDVFKTLLFIFEKNPTNSIFQTGIVQCFRSVIEENFQELDKEENGTPLKYLIPILIKLFSHKSSDVRKYAIRSCCTILNQSYLPNSFADNMQAFLSGLSHLAVDNSTDVKLYVLRAFILLLPYPTFVSKILKIIVTYVLTCHKSGVETLMQESCDFWSEICKSQYFNSYVKFVVPLVNEIIPLVIHGMIYNEFDRNFIEEEMKRETEMSNIKPNFRKSENNSNNNINEDTFQYYSIGSEWDHRRCASHTLETMSKRLSNYVLPITISTINSKLFSKNVSWWGLESGILALGAIAIGCKEQFFKSSELSKIIFFLLNVLSNNSTPMIISTTFWTLSRFVEYIVGTGNKKMFEETLGNILKKMVHSNGHIQEASCICFSAFVEEAEHKLADPYCGECIKALSIALGLYGKRNLMILYDTIGTFADYLEFHLKKRDDFLKGVITKIFEHWKMVDERSHFDQILISILECISCIIKALGDNSKQFIPVVWNKCIQLIRDTYKQFSKLENMEKIKEKMSDGPEKKKMIIPCPPDKELVSSSIDTLDRIIEVFSSGVQNFINDDFLRMVGFCMSDRNPSVKGVVFGLIGGMSRVCYPQMKKAVNQYLLILISNIKEGQKFTVLNNIMWSLGCLAMQKDQNILSHFETIMSKTVGFLKKDWDKIPSSLRENIVVCYARMAIAFPNVAPKYFHAYAVEYCKLLVVVGDPEERYHVFKALIILLNALWRANTNQNTVISCFPSVIGGIAKYLDPNPPNDLREEFSKLLNGYKQGFGNEFWSKSYVQIPQEIRNLLKNNYGFE